MKNSKLIIAFSALILALGGAFKAKETSKKHFISYFAGVHGNCQSFSSPCLNTGSNTCKTSSVAGARTVWTTSQCQAQRVLTN